MQHYLLTIGFRIPYFEIVKLHLTANEFARLAKVDQCNKFRDGLSPGRITKALKQPRSGYWRIPISAYEEMVKKNVGR